MADDPSNGYEAIAEKYMAVRSHIGRGIVEQWAASLPPGGAVVDVGAGSGVPITSVLVEAGLDVFAIDAAPTMVSAFQRRFPDLQIACEPAEQSNFFGRAFNGVLAIGLVFLLSADDQRVLLHRMTAALNPGGRLLFSAPRQQGTWEDLLTGKSSLSLGAPAYRRLLAESGVRVVDEYVDEGETHYYSAVKDGSL